MRLELNILLFIIFPLIIVGQLVCPPAQYYRPCSCNNWGDGAAWLFCFNLNLNDTKTSQILSAFLSYQSVISPLGAVTLNENKLTKVPDEIKFFPRLVYVNLAGNNIRTIQRGTFNFTLTADRVLLFENEINFIEPGAFQGNYGQGSFISLYENKLTRFEAEVFEPVLEQMAPYDGSYVFIMNNPIDCKSDPCHLSWLIRDNRHLLNSVDRGTCSDGTEFDHLDQDAFLSCPAVTTTTNAISSPIISTTTTSGGNGTNLHLFIATSLAIALLLFFIFNSHPVVV